MKDDPSISIHPTHGLAPILTACITCHSDLGLILTGAKCDEISEKLFGKPYDQVTSHHRLLEGTCDKCKALLKKGAVGFITAKGDSLMLSKPFVKRNPQLKIKSGKVYKLEQDAFDQLKSQMEGVMNEETSTVE